MDHLAVWTSPRDRTVSGLQGLRFHTEPPLRNRVATAIIARIFKGVNSVLPWHRLWLPLSLLNLAMFRQELRQKNLIDTEPREADGALSRARVR